MNRLLLQPGGFGNASWLMKWCMGLEAVMEITYPMTISVIHRTDQAFCRVALMDSSFQSEHLLHQSENWLILSCSLIVVFTESTAESFLLRIKSIHSTCSRLDLPTGGISTSLWLKRIRREISIKVTEWPGKCLSLMGEKLNCNLGRRDLISQAGYSVRTVNRKRITKE